MCNNVPYNHEEINYSIDKICVNQYIYLLQQ